ncbi:MAG: DUF3592 domain-containing protein [Propionibacteriales bacterium]|nr:DUF3592 domain-containing protein [Propionibacteriales bacterium]
MTRWACCRSSCSGSGCCSPARARAGDQVTVLYDPEDPALASLPRDGASRLAVFFVVFGLGAAAVGRCFSC